MYSVECGVRSVVCVECRVWWSVECCGVWSVECGVWSGVRGVSSVEYKVWSVECAVGQVWRVQCAV